MTPEQRTAIREAAKYLREVRPLDPDELVQYVEGQPHPAAVRQVLREATPELALIERQDGLFEPAPNTPVEPLTTPVGAFPETYTHRLEEVLVQRYGPAWYEGESGDQLRDAIRKLKEDYYQDREVAYTQDTALGYAIYHLPDYYAAIQYVLSELAAADLLDRPLRILDVGAGVGGPMLGVHDFFPNDALIEYYAVEPSDAMAEILEVMVDGTHRNFHATIHRTDAESFTPTREYDLLLFANSLSELTDPTGVIERLSDTLTPTGSILGLAPADRETSIYLREIERAVTNGLSVYSPTLRLWPGWEPADTCWSFTQEPDLEVPLPQHQLDTASAGDGEFVNRDVQYSYFILRADGKQRIHFEPNEDRYAMLGASDQHITDRINCVAVKLSLNFSTDGNEVFLIGDGSQQIDHYAVLVQATTLNDSLATASYGAVLQFEQTLTLWNEDEQAVNLIVDENTIVDILAPGASVQPKQEL